MLVQSEAFGVLMFGVVPYVAAELLEQTVMMYVL